MKKFTKSCTKGQKKHEGFKVYSNNYERHNFVKETDEKFFL